MKQSDGRRRRHSTIVADDIGYLLEFADIQIAVNIGIFGFAGHRKLSVA